MNSIKLVLLSLILFLLVLFLGCNEGNTSLEGAHNYYFGQFHSHTNYSDGDGAPEQAFKCARYEGHADFFAVTDHSNYFDNGQEWKWDKLRQIANSYNKDNEFVAIAGFEMTWNAGTGGWGHINTYNTPWLESRNNSAMNLQAFYSKIASDTDSLSQWNHPGDKYGDFADFAYYDTNVDNVIKLVEVGNGDGAPGTNYYHPSYSYYTRALDKGWHVAPSNNQDNHQGKWITANDCRTVILAPRLTRSAIFDAVRKLRVYATEDKDLKVCFKINNYHMGTILTKPETLDLTAEVEDGEMFDKISKIEVIANGGEIAASADFDSSNVHWETQLDSQNRYTYYYLKVSETDGDIAVTAPVWVE